MPLPPDTSRRTFLKEAGLAACAAAGAAGAIIVANRQLQPSSAGSRGVSGPYYVRYGPSDARSNWHRDKEGLPMRVSEFPGPGHGAQGRIDELEMDVVVVYLAPGLAAPTMRGIVPPGLVAFNARCSHFPCSALWRNEGETEDLIPIDGSHDLIVCPCHLGTFDPYDSGWVRFGPPPQPLDQLRVAVRDDLVQILFENYKFGGGTPQV